MKYNILDEKIVYFEDVVNNFKYVSDFLLNKKTDYISNWAIWSKWQGDVLHDYGIKKNVWGGRRDIGSSVTISNDGLEDFDVIGEFKEDIKACANKYKDLYSIELPYNDNPEYVITSYRNNSEWHDLGGHIDIEGEYEEYSLVYYFNDDYYEGKVEFPSFNISLKPKANSLLIFPSYDPYFHLAQKSYEDTNHKIYMAQFWSTGPGAGYTVYDEKEKDKIIEENLLIDTSKWGDSE